MTNIDIKNKILEGSKIAIQRLLESKYKSNGFIVISENGKAVKLNVRENYKNISVDK